MRCTRPTRPSRSLTLTPRGWLPRVRRSATMPVTWWPVGWSCLRTMETAVWPGMREAWGGTVEDDCGCWRRGGRLLLLLCGVDCPFGRPRPPPPPLPLPLPRPRPSMVLKCACNPFQGLPRELCALQSLDIQMTVYYLTLAVDRIIEKPQFLLTGTLSRPPKIPKLFLTLQFPFILPRIPKFKCVAKMLCRWSGTRSFSSFARLWYGVRYSKRKQG